MNLRIAENARFLSVRRLLIERTAASRAAEPTPISLHSPPDRAEDTSGVVDPTGSGVYDQTGPRAWARPHDAGADVGPAARRFRDGDSFGGQLVPGTGTPDPRCMPPPSLGPSSTIAVVATT